MTRDLEQLCKRQTLCLYQTVGSVITEVLAVMRPLLSTDSELVMRFSVSPTLTYYQVTINQLVALVDIHLKSVIYCWTVLIYKMLDEDTSLSPVSEICLKLLTIVLLLILSNTSIVIAYYSICFVRFSSFYFSLF